MNSYETDRSKGRLPSPKVIGLAAAASLFIGASSVGVGWQLSQPPPPHIIADELLLASFDAFAAPLPSSLDLDPERVSLGRDLFQDERLSGNQDLACVSCHLLEEGGDDGLSRSYGTSGAQTGTNSLTVLNSGLQFTLFWDGRVSSLEDQIDGPLLNPNIMAASWPTVIARLSADDDYRQRFLEIYGGEITPDTVRNAIATFERSLITPHSPFDRYLLGDEGAMTEREVAGYELFRALGCGSCHQGRLLGGNLFQRLGIYRDYFEDRGQKTKADNGRFNVTSQEEDLHHFRVPSLRNVATTAPYFHDGSVKTLGEAVEVMAEYQLGRSLSAEERDLLVTFLHTLTGASPGSSIAGGGSS